MLGIGFVCLLGGCLMLGDWVCLFVLLGDLCWEMVLLFGTSTAD